MSNFQEMLRETIRVKPEHPGLFTLCAGHLEDGRGGAYFDVWLEAPGYDPKRVPLAEYRDGVRIVKG